MDYEKALQDIAGSRLITNATIAERERVTVVSLAIVDIAESLNYLSRGAAAHDGPRPSTGEFFPLRGDDFTLVSDDSGVLIAAIAHGINDDDRHRLIDSLQAGLAVNESDELGVVGDDDLPWLTSTTSRASGLNEVVAGTPVRHRGTDQAGMLGLGSGVSEGEPWVDVTWEGKEAPERVWLSELGPDFGRRDEFGAANLPALHDDELDELDDRDDEEIGETNA